VPFRFWIMRKQAGVEFPMESAGQRRALQPCQIHTHVVSWPKCEKVSVNGPGRMDRGDGRSETGVDFGLGRNSTSMNSHPALFFRALGKASVGKMREDETDDGLGRAGDGLEQRVNPQFRVERQREGEGSYRRVYRCSSDF